MVNCRIIIIPCNTSQTQDMVQPLLVSAKKDGNMLKVRVGDLIEQLKKPILEKVRNFMVSYFCHKIKSFIYIGSNQFSKTDILAEKIQKSGLGLDVVANQKKAAAQTVNGERNANDAEENLWDLLGEQTNEVVLKFREKAKSQDSDTLVSANAEEGKGSRREKERKIGEVVIKVCAWRRLYNEHRVTLEVAAEKVGISKKSLDDYFLQLK